MVFIVWNPYNGVWEADVLDSEILIWLVFIVFFVPNCGFLENWFCIFLLFNCCLPILFYDCVVLLCILPVHSAPFFFQSINYFLIKKKMLVFTNSPFTINEKTLVSQFFQFRTEHRKHLNNHTDTHKHTYV